MGWITATAPEQHLERELADEAERRCEISFAKLWQLGFHPIQDSVQRGGVFENITYRNIKLHEAKRALGLNLEWRMVPPVAPPATVLPVVRNVNIINVSGDVESVRISHGFSGARYRVSPQDCKITAKKRFKLDDARNVDLTGLSLDLKDGDAITTVDVEQARRK